MGFRPPVCTFRLNRTRRTSWWWWDEPQLIGFRSAGVQLRATPGGQQVSLHVIASVCGLMTARAPFLTLSTNIIRRCFFRDAPGKSIVRIWSIILRWSALGTVFVSTVVRWTVCGDRDRCIHVNVHRTSASTLVTLGLFFCCLRRWPRLL